MRLPLDQGSEKLPAGAGKSVRVLQLEADPADAEVELAQLRSAGFSCAARRVATRDAFLAALEDFAPDVIFAEDQPLAFDVRSALALARARHPEIPLIIVSGVLDGADAVQLLQAGAHDFIQKDRMARLGSAVERALEYERARRARFAAERVLKESELQFRTLFENAPIASVVADPTGVILRTNRAFTELLGYSEAEVVDKSVDAFTLPEDRAITHTKIGDIARGVQPVAHYEKRYRHKDGHVVPVVATLIASMVAGKTVLIAQVVDLSDAKRLQADNEQARNALAASERRFRAMTENAADIVVVTDAQGVINYVSPSVHAIAGYAPEEMRGHSMLEFVDPNGVQNLQKAFAQILGSSGRIDRIERLYRHKDGRLRMFEVVSQNLLQDPAIAGVVVNLRDITERKKAERELELFRALIDQASDAIEVVDPDTLKFLDVNKKACSELGYSREELLAMTVSDIDPDIKSTYFGAVEQQLRESGAAQFESVHRRKDGSRFPVEVNTSRVMLDRVYQVVMVRDISERKRAAEALARSEAWFRSLIENIEDLVVVLDAEGLITYASPAARVVSGYAPEELIGKSHALWTHPDDLPGTTAMLAELGRTPGGVMRAEARYRVKSGAWRVAETTLRNLLALPGVNGIVMTMHDITEPKEAEAKLRAITGAAMDGVILMDCDGKLAFWNEAAQRILGYTEAEAMGKDLHALIAPAPYRDRFREGLPQFRATGTGAVIGKTLELQALRKDGTELPVELSTSSVMLGGRWNAVGILRDISARKLQEQALMRVNRTLKTLSACDSAVVHAASEAELLQQMCRTVVEVGGYPLAWVGFAEQDAAKTVRPVAWAGAGEAYVLSADISWADTELGRGPTGLCIRTGKPQVARAIDADSLMVPWRAEALKFGYQSSVALPLAGPSGVFGALSIYAGERDAFDSDELVLLAEMASDLAYGIVARRTIGAHAEGLQRLERSMEATVHALASTVETRDRYTAGHQRRVADLASAIAREMGLSDDRIRGLNLAATVHDIGKVTVPVEFLAKPGKLTPLEFELIKTHAEAGYQILKDIEFPWPVAEMVRQHHERLDGSGYPRGLKADQILLESKILTVADVVEAMSSHRPYRPGKGIDAALDEIDEGRGTLFDAGVVDACLTLFRKRGFQIPE